MRDVVRPLLGVGTALAVGLIASPAAAATASSAVGYTVSSSTSPDWTYPTAAMRVSDAAKAIRADVAYRNGYTGKGVGVALIDTGVAPVAGLTSGNIFNGPDLSLESQIPSLYQKDTYGHGTHMAGIIAGRDNVNGTGFRGIAPDAKLTSIKIGSADGAVDVTQMLAAIDWVVKHRDDDPANPIRVLNLSYGTDSAHNYASDPIIHAVENATAANIVVVVAAGNNNAGDVTNPAFDDGYILAVGAADGFGTTNPSDDNVASFSARGDWRPVDLVAPGRSITSLRNPGSFVDTNYPTGRFEDRYFKGSGTSQAAAVVSGAVALMLQKYPTATPRTVRSTLVKNASPMPKATYPNSRGAGGLNIGNVFDGSTFSDLTTFANGGVIGNHNSTGYGTLQTARGTSKLTFGGGGGTTLSGEKDIFGSSFSTTNWAKASLAGTSWVGGSWMGRPLTGDGWGSPVAGQASWLGRYWSGTSWSGRYWSNIAWSGRYWSGSNWAGVTAGTTDPWGAAGWQAGSWSSCSVSKTVKWMF